MGAFQTYIRTNNNLDNSCCLTAICEMKDVFSDKYNFRRSSQYYVNYECPRTVWFNIMMGLSEPDYIA